MGAGGGVGVEASTVIVLSGVTAVSVGVGDPPPVGVVQDAIEKTSIELVMPRILDVRRIDWMRCPIARCTRVSSCPHIRSTLPTGEIGVH